MKLIRRNVFETNSSSTHVVSVPKKVNDEEWVLYSSLDKNYQFGREESRLVEYWDEKLAYAYTVLNEFKKLKYFNIKITDEIINEFKENVNKCYNELLKITNFVPYSRSLTPNDIFKYVETEGEFPLGDVEIYIDGLPQKPWVDHPELFGKNGFISRLITDKEFLKRFIFNKDAYITIGGDEYRSYNVKTIGFEYDYKCKGHDVNEKGEEPPEDWFDKDGYIKDEYWSRYRKEYPYDNSDFWKKLKEYEKNNDVYLKGN